MHLFSTDFHSFNCLNKLCDYKCGQVAKYQLKNGKFCCSEYYTKCPQNRKKNSIGLKIAYKEGKIKHTYNPDAHKNIRNKTVLKYEDVFIKNSVIRNNTLRDIILRDNLIEYKCEKCSNDGEWLGEIIVLDLDHKNGDSSDNRLENLRFLCPNCHSQTPTYGSKNKKKKKIDKDKIINAIKTSICVTEALKKCGLVPKGGNFGTIYKIMIENNIALLPKNIKEKNKCKCGKIILKNSKECDECYRIRRRKVERPSYEQLIKEIEDTNYCCVGRKYGVSDNAVRRWIFFYEKKMGIETKKKRKLLIEKFKSDKCKCGNKKKKESVYCSKCAQLKSRKVERPSYEQLIKEIEETNRSVVGRKYGVHRNTVKKWVERYEMALN